MGQKRNYANQKRQTLEIPLYQKKTKKIKDRIITNISTLFWKRRRKRRKKEIREKKHNERLIKDRLIRGIRTLFKQEEDYYKPGRVIIPETIIALNMEVMVIKTETYH